MIVFAYDTERYDFRTRVAAGLGVSDLSVLHTEPGPPSEWPVRRQEHWWLARLYATVGDAMLDLYTRFLHEAAQEHVGRVRIWQRRVCFRVQLPRVAPAEPNFHCDATWGQREGVLNLWIPYTSVSGTNTLWVESSPGKNDHRPIDLDYGQALIFEGGPLSHGSVTNYTSITRISGDLRFMPGKDVMA